MTHSPAISKKSLGDKPSSRESTPQRLIAQGDLTDAEHRQRGRPFFYAFLDTEDQGERL